jgi:diguanylate cyclase (GGDEF)-like protein
MNIRAETTSDPKRAIPAELYVSLVDSLYADVRTFLFGVVAAFTGAAYAAYLTAEPLLDLFPFLILTTGAIRAARIVQYKRVRRQEALAYDDARRWEREYTFGANAYVFTLGLWCFASFILSDNDVAHLFSIAVVLSYLVGITGRNFANDRFVNQQLVVLGVPLVAGLVVRGNVDHIVLACFAIPFFGSMRSIAGRLRDMLLDAVMARRDMELLASRFDTALNNMPHGLAMFDASGRLVVLNERWAEMLPSDEQAVQAGSSAGAVFGAYVRGGLIAARDASRILETFGRRSSERTTNNLEIETSDRQFDITFQPMETGGLVVVIEDITEKRRTEARMAHMARHDALTGLPNRIQFQERLEVALSMRAESDMLAVLFVDLDNFKQVNDTLGHTVGDTLLIEVADRLRFVVGEGNVVARFGADEFVVLQSGVKNANEVASLAGRIIENLSDMVQIEGSVVVCNASIGIALAPRDGGDPDQLLKSADMALARAKAGGKGILHFYEEAMDRQAQARRATELDLRKAIHNDELAVYFQPLLNLRTLKISTCEALVRWPHPTRGMVSPGEFIPIAEETGLVVELGRQVLRKACAACATWPNDVRVAVNLSQVQFERDDVVAVVRDTLQATGLAPGRLELEITESLLLQESLAILDTLNALRAMGVGIALDDFGTGYSSLSYLQRFPLQKVKIDRSFVRNLETDPKSVKLLHGVTRLCADLGFAIAVEGVETHGQMKLVDAVGVVNELQGFLLSPAIPDEQVRVLFNRSGERLLKRVA